MKKLIVGLLFVSNLVLFAKVNIVVTVPPQKSFVEKIGGEFVHVDVMVPIGADPHNYEPKPSQMRAIAKANVYMKIGLNEFEKPWLPKFSAQNENMKIEDITKNVNHIAFEEHEHEAHKEHDSYEDEQADEEHEYEHEHEEHHHSGEDPHIWMSPKEVKNMAKNIVDTLIAYDKKHKEAYLVNYEKFVKEIEVTDKKIKEILKDVPNGAKMMVFHPAFGYFARDYNLVQFPIEFEGKEPKPKILIEMIKEAKEEKIKVIITEPEFSTKSAKVIAKEVGATVKSISPLTPNWAENLIELAKIIAISYNK